MLVVLQEISVLKSVIFNISIADAWKWHRIYCIISKCSNIMSAAEAARAQVDLEKYIHIIQMSE